MGFLEIFVPALVGCLLVLAGRWQGRRAERARCMDIAIEAAQTGGQNKERDGFVIAARIQRGE